MKNTKEPKIETAAANTPLKIGDRVTYTNEYGVPFPGKTIKSFSLESDWNNHASLDCDSDWVPKPLNSLTLEDKPNFLYLEHYGLDSLHLVNPAKAFSKPIGDDRFKSLVTARKLEAARTYATAHYERIECPDYAERLRRAEFKSPRLGVSDGSIGLRGCLTLLVELGDEMVAMTAGKAWNYLASENR